MIQIIVDSLPTLISTLAGAFVGGLLAYLSSLGLEWIKRVTELGNNSTKLLLIIKDNNNVIEKIKEFVDNGNISPEGKYDVIFGRHNFDYVIHPIDTYFTSIQADLYIK